MDPETILAGVQAIDLLTSVLKNYMAGNIDATQANSIFAQASDNLSSAIATFEQAKKQSGT